MNKVFNFFMVLGLIVVGLLIGILLPRPMTEHERGSAGIKVMPGRTEPQTPPAREGFSLLPKRGLAGKWEATWHFAGDQFSQPRDDHYETEFLTDGTYIDTHSVIGNEQWREKDIGTWKEIEGQRVLINTDQQKNKLYSYTIKDNTLTLSSDVDKHQEVYKRR